MNRNGLLGDVTTIENEKIKVEDLLSPP